MGYQSYDERFHANWQVNASLLRRLADVNGSLVVTIYRQSDYPGQG